MAMGLGYDSDGGRSMAAALTSLMTGTSYKRSAELAAIVGPYAGYQRNAEAHKRVMRKHQAANDVVRVLHTEDGRVHKLATAAWADVIATGEANGFRNAQASVLAPTGTIGFMMDCDTTGIEPDFSLVKFKKLVGGGSMQIVNQTIPRALEKMGYQPEQVEAIVAFIGENGHVIDAPGLKQEHYEIFDTAMGVRSLKADGPRADDGGLPAVPVRRDLQDGQPPRDRHGRGDRGRLHAVLEARSQGDRDLPRQLQGRPAALRRQVGQGQARPGPDASDAATSVETKVVEKVVYAPTRKRLPKSRVSRTTSFTVGGAEGYMTSGAHDDGELGEVFLKLGKQGSTLAGVMDAFSIAVSIGLQYGVPLETYVSKFTNLRFEPAGLTDDPDVRMAQSLMDYVWRRLALDYMSFEDRAGLGIYSAEERQRQLETGLLRARRWRRPARPPNSSRPRTSWSRTSPRSPWRPRTRTAPRLVEVPVVRSSARRPHLGRAVREADRDGRRLAAVHDLRDEDAPRRVVLRLRGLREHVRLQLIVNAERGLDAIGVGPLPFGTQTSMQGGSLRLCRHPRSPVGMTIHIAGMSTAIGTVPGGRTMSVLVDSGRSIRRPRLSIGLPRRRRPGRGCPIPLAGTKRDTGTVVSGRTTWDRTDVS